MPKMDMAPYHCQISCGLKPNPGKPVGAQRKSRFIGELKIQYSIT
jgi:hypothetical protein